MPLEKRVDWEVAKNCLAEIQREAPEMLRQAVVIGGVACWFYRSLLSKSTDPEFKVPDLSPADRQKWLSKDIDFTNIFSEDARNFLRQFVWTDSRGQSQIQIAGVPLGFAQVGVTFDPESAWAESWVVSFTSGTATVQCHVVDPITLYREKLALSERRGYESDRMHRDLLAEFLRSETVRQVDLLATESTVEKRVLPLKFLKTLRDRAIEICDDSRVGHRLKQRLAEGNDFAPAERNVLRDLLQESASE